MWQDDEISILDLLLVLARNRRLIFYIVTLFTATGLLYALTADLEYTASAKVIREATDNSMTNLRGLSLLSNFGISLGGTSTGLTVDAYSDVLASREVRLSVIRDTFYIRELNDRMPFVKYVNQPGFLSSLLGTGKERHYIARDTIHWHFATPDKEEDAAMKVLANIVNTSIDRETGLMEISVTTKDPHLSAAIINSLVKHLTERVRQIHMEKVQISVEFIRERFEEAQRQLLHAEEDLARFRDQNYNPQSAQLRTQLERLQRTVSFKTELYSELQTQLTQAEIELQKTLPAVTVLEEPSPPIRPSAPNRISIIVFSILMGSFVAVAAALARSVWTLKSTDEIGRAKLQEIREAFLPRAIIGRSPRPESNASQDHTSTTHS